MKIKILIIVFAILKMISAYCGGISEMDLVNTQEIELDKIEGIDILYRSESITLFNGTTDKLIVKEYMSENNSKYYARITSLENKLIIERGDRPFGLFSIFNARVEIYLPASYSNMISVKTTSGSIEAGDNYIGSAISMESSSGSISVNELTANTINLKASSGSIRCKTANGNTNIHTSSGSIAFEHINGEVFAEASSGRITLNLVTGGVTAKNSSGGIRCGTVNGDVKVRADSGSIAFERIDGNVSAETSSGRIALNLVTGDVTVKNSSGGIHCTVSESAGDISLTTSSGGIELNLPRNYIFNFSSRTSSGGLSTPFQDKLYSPVSDKHAIQGVIGIDNAIGNTPENDINIKTNSGSIRVNWI